MNYQLRIINVTMNGSNCYPKAHSEDTDVAIDTALIVSVA